MIFNKEQQQFIKDNADGLRNEELTRRLNEKYKTHFTVGQVKKYKYSHHISSGLKSCNVPVGSERETKGYILVKIAEPNVWKEKHRIIYEKHFGKIPTGHKIIFLDGNKTNSNIHNLRLVRNDEMAYLNKMGYTGVSKEMTEVAVNLVKLKNMLKEK